MVWCGGGDGEYWYWTQILFVCFGQLEKLLAISHSVLQYRYSSTVGDDECTQVPVLVFICT